MSRQATRDTAVNERFSSLRLIGGNDVLADRLAKYPDLDVDGGARIRKSLVVTGDTVLQGELTIEGNLMLLGNSNIGMDGNLSGEFTGNTFGKHTGEVCGDVTGNVTGDLCGNIIIETMTPKTSIITVASDINVNGNVETNAVKVSGVQVVGVQQANVGNLMATDVVVISGSGADVDINNNFANVVSALNSALDVLRAHGLMG